MRSRIEFFSISKLLFVTAILLTPFNYDFLILRFNEILIFFSFITLFTFYFNSKIYKLLIVILITYAILLLSQVIALVHGKQFHLVGGIFFVKWFFIFAGFYLVYFFVVSRLKDIRFYSTITFIVFIFLSAWVFIYIALNNSGFINGSSRVSFPFSSDYFSSDAHSYSSLLAILLFLYIFVINKVLGHNPIITISSIFLGLSALIFTGSRGGILMLAMGFLIIFLRYLSSINLRRINISFFVLIIIFPIFIFFFLDFFSKSPFFSELLIRAFNFELYSDQSSLSRLSKLEIALSELSATYFILGVGPMSARLMWYDGIFSILIAHGGIILLLFCFIILSLFITSVSTIKAHRFYKTIIYSLFFMYLLSNAITEFIFLTRNFFLVFLSFGLAIAFAKSSSSSQAF